jgi:hypothetical protein
MRKRQFDRNQLGDIDVLAIVKLTLSIAFQLFVLSNTAC